MTGVSTSREVVYSIVERTGLDLLTDAVLASFAERAEFQPLRAPRDELRPWVTWNIELIIRWFNGQPPTEDELDRFRWLGRTSAADGTPPDTVPANYRLAFRAVWSVLRAAATDEERAALLDGATLLFEFGDRVSRVYAEAYETAARSGPVSVEERGTQALITRLGADQDTVAEDHAIAERVGFDLAGPFHPFVISIPGRSVEQHMALARRLRARHVLAASRGRRVHGFAHGALPWRELDLGADAVFAAGESTLRSELGAALDELRVLVEIAVSRGQAGAVSLSDHLPAVLLHRVPRLARLMHARVYAPLGGENAELARTLDSLIEHDFDRGRTAASLPVHRNTLTKRIDRISALSGVDLDTAEGCGLAWLAWLSAPERTPATAGRTEPAAAMRER